MKNVFFFGSIIMLLNFSCSNPSNLEAKKAELEQLKSDLNTLQTSIINLEKEIALLDTTVQASSGILVSVDTLKPKKFEHYFTVNGTIEADKNISVTTEYPGQIKMISVKEGQSVSKGQTLAVINAASIQSQLEEVKKNYAFANTLYEKQKKLWEQKIGSEIQYLEAKNRKETLEQTIQTLKAQIDLAVISAPEAGIVDKIYLKEGEFLAPGMPLFQIVDLNKVKLVSDVSEIYLPYINAGDTAIISFPILANKSFRASINRTGNIIEPRNRTFKVEIQIDNNDKTLKPNVVGNLRLRDYVRDSSIVVPASVISLDSKGQFVYIADKKDAKNIAKKVYIKTGKSENSNTLVESGLNVGDKIIVGGYNQVSNGAEIKF
jgi:RND family efflux transporter MFP subunit